MSGKKKLSFWQIVFPLLVALPFPFTLMNCARESTPTGGPIDTIAPYAVFEKPVNNSLNSSPKKIIVKFNEFVELDNIDDNCMISPMFKEKPDISVKKKKMTIDLSKQTLQPNTTYSFNFSNAIKDLSEGNSTNQYLYAFSTGASIDSMRLAGSVKYAKTGTIPEQALVLLYDNLSDTAIKTQKPRYATRISKKGEFSFKNIEAKPYRIYALVDSDNDYMFNQSTEKIAFLDTIFNPTAERFTDTVWYTHNDTTFFEEFEDSIQVTHVRDSFNLEERTRWSNQNIELLLFDNNVWYQDLQSYTRINKYALACKFAAKNNMPTTIVSSPKAKFEQENISSDSLVLWLTDTTLNESDSSKLLITYHEFKESQKTRTDTIMVNSVKEFPQRLLITSTLDKNNKIYGGDSIFITLSRPLKSYDLSKIALYESCDTTKSAECQKLLSRTDLQYRPKVHYQEQGINKYKKIGDRFAFYFNKEIEPSQVNVTLSGLPNLTDWYYCELDKQSNALLFWLKPNTDALRLKNLACSVTYAAEDGTTKTETFNDKKEVAVDKKYKVPTSNKRIILDMSSKQAEQLLPHEPIRIVCNNPVRTITDSLFSLVNREDSTETSLITRVEISPESMRTILIHHKAQAGRNYTLSILRNAIIDTFGTSSREFIKEIATDISEGQFGQKVPFTIAPTAKSSRTFGIAANWKENTNYTLIIPDNSFNDVFNDTNDSLSYAFLAPKHDNVGNLLIKNTKGLPNGNLVFVIEGKDSKEPTSYIGTQTDEGIAFANVLTGAYSLRCYVDENNNKQWDSGCYEIKQQPETIFFYKESITIKSEWSNSIYWEDFK